MAANDSEIREILKGSSTIAVVGCSRDPMKAAYAVPAYLQRHGYRIIPVNPSADTILGEKAHPKLSDIKEHVDIVDVFRPAGEAEGIVEEALKLEPRPKLIWIQEGIKSEKAKSLAEEAGIPYVQDRCLMKEHAKMRRSGA